MTKLSVSAVVVLALAGCMGSGDTSSDTASVASDVRAGARCGGGTQHAPVCNHGLVCVFPHSPPRPGESGTCEHPPACVQNTLCVLTAHWDAGQCRCVPNDTDAGTVCVQRTLCVVTAHWDTTLCQCVPNTGSCDRASDCTGALPDFCRTCSNGRSACAHWSCTNHVCTLATCPN